MCACAAAWAASVVRGQGLFSGKPGAATSSSGQAQEAATAQQAGQALPGREELVQNAQPEVEDGTSFDMTKICGIHWRRACLSCVQVDIKHVGECNREYLVPGGVGGAGFGAEGSQAHRWRTVGPMRWWMCNVVLTQRGGAGWVAGWQVSSEHDVKAGGCDDN
jgi:hypothetical protein